MINKLKHIPIAVIWSIFMVVSFTFVDYTWILETFPRFMFVVLVIIGGGVCTAINSDFKFWVPKK